MINQRGKTLEATLARGMEGVWPCRLYKHSSCDSVTQKQSRRVIRESVIQFIRFIHSLNSLQPFIHTRAYNSYIIHTVNSQSDLVVKYTCFTKNTHPLFQPLSDGSKRPDEGTTGTHGHHIHRVVPVQAAIHSRITSNRCFIKIRDHRRAHGPTCTRCINLAIWQRAFFIRGSDKNLPKGLTNRRHRYGK